MTFSAVCVLVLALGPGATDGAAAIPASERQALLDLYDATNGAAWTVNTGWYGAAGTECGWFGITCDAGETTVTHVLLDSNNLSGTLPASLGNLAGLTQLWLANNSLSGAVPASLGTLSNLTMLSFYENYGLSGGIPAELGNLSNLVLLNLNSTTIGGSIPAELGNLLELRFLLLSGADLTGTIPVEIANLTNLVRLDLGNNQLSGAIPAAIGDLTTLTQLWLGSNQLSGSIPPQLGNLINLTEFRLEGNQLTGSLPPELMNLTNLIYFAVHANQLTGPLPAGFSNMTSLRYLWLSNNAFSGPIPEEISSITTLRYLWLYDNAFSGPIPASLGNLVNLEHLWLSSNMLSGAIPTSLTNLVNLPDDANEFRWNALYSTDATLTAFLNAKQREGGDWQSTQTIAPTGVSAVQGATNTAAVISWTPIAFTSYGGGYTVSRSESLGGPFVPVGSVTPKTASSLTVTGLTPGTEYFFVVHTETEPNFRNDNTVVSEASTPASLTTAPLGISPASLPDGRRTQAYSQTLSGSGGIAPYAFAVVDGGLPPGLSLAPDGSLTGTPTTAGSYDFVVEVSDDAGSLGSHSYTLVIDEPVTLEILPATLPAGLVGQAYSQALSGSGGSGPYEFSLADGALPPGLSLSTAGLLAGTPTAAGTFSFEVAVTDSLSNSGARSYSIVVSQQDTEIPALAPAGLALLAALLALGALLILRRG